MSELRELLRPKEPSRNRPTTMPTTDNVIPIGIAARRFMEEGAPIGEQRITACAVARNLHSAGISIDDAADMLFEGLSRSPQDPARAPWTWQDAYDIADDIASKPAPPMPPFDEVEIIIPSAPALTEAPEETTTGDNYRLRFAEFDLIVEVGRIEFGKDIFGWMRVIRNGSALGEKRVDLSSPNGFNSTLRYLSAREPSLPWPAILDAVSTYVLDAIRRGDPTVILNEIEPAPRPTHRLDPLIREGMPNLFYGLGGTGKSLLLYYLGLLVQSGTSSAEFTVSPGNVLLLDWELDAGTVLPTMEALARGLGIERDRWPIHYKRSSGSLVEEADNIGLYIKQHDIELVLIDSLGRACGGDKNSQEVVQRMFGAMRRWPPVTIACLDHVAKPQGKKKSDTPYGSVYTLNDVRSGFMVEGSMDEGSNELYMTVKQTKRNFGPVAPIGLRFEFLPTAEAPETIKVTRDKRQLGTAHERIMAVLQSGDNWFTADELAMSTGMAPEVARKRAEEMFESQRISRRKRAGSVENGRKPFEYGL